MSDAVTSSSEPPRVRAVLGDVGIGSTGVANVPIWRRFSLRITLLFSALALALLGGMGVVSYRWALDAERSALSVRLEALAIALAAGTDADDVPVVMSGRSDARARYEHLVARFAAVGADEPDVQSVYLVVRDDEEGWVRFVADWVRTDEPATIGQRYDATRAPVMLEAFGGPRVEEEITVDEWGASLSGFAPVRDGEGNAVGVLGVDVSAARVAGLDERVLRHVVWVHGAALVFLALAGLALGRSVRRPIQRIIDASAAIVSGQPSARVGLARSDELGILAAHFDRMAEGLEERERLRAIFGRYVSEEVARRVLASPDASQLGGQEREVSVLFIDLTRFSILVEELEPAVTVEVLERYSSAITTLVEEHGGCVIEMLGDAILAAFGAPEALEDHAAHAVRCAVAVKAELESLKRAWGEEGLSVVWRDRGVDLRPRVGVHTGIVVAGNTGGRTRMKYAILGDTVNLTARLEALNDTLGTIVLVSGETHARLPEELAARGEPRGEHAVKGRSALVQVYAY